MCAGVCACVACLILVLYFVLVYLYAANNLYREAFVAGYAFLCNHCPHDVDSVKLIPVSLNYSAPLPPQQMRLCSTVIDHILSAVGLGNTAITAARLYRGCTGAS